MGAERTTALADHIDLNQVGDRCRLRIGDVEVIQTNALDNDQLISLVGGDQLVIGNERWLHQNGASVNEQTMSILAHEQNEGNIAVLCAVNGM
jgi:cation transport ATPase